MNFIRNPRCPAHPTRAVVKGSRHGHTIWKCDICGRTLGAASAHLWDLDASKWPRGREETPLAREWNAWDLEWMNTDRPTGGWKRSIHLGDDGVMRWSTTGEPVLRKDG